MKIKVFLWCRACNDPVSMHPKHQSNRIWSLDWLNFWIADVQTGIAPFLAAALTARGWSPSHIGTFLTVGGVTGLCFQAPAGAVVDATPRKRTLIALSVAGVAAASLLLANGQRFRSLLCAQLLLGAVGAFIAPALIAITLGLVGNAAFDARLGRNQSFNSAGNLFSALLMGWIGWHWGVQAIFFTVPLLALPTLLSLAAIPGNRIDHKQARGTNAGRSQRISGLRILFSDCALLAFAVAGFLFHLSNAAMLPQLGELLTHGRARAAAPFTSASVSVTQLVIALTSSAIGRMSGRRGPRRMLLAGFAVLPIRGMLYTLTSAVPLLLAIQVLDGVANAIFGVPSVVYIADRTRGSGHFNLAMGAFGTAVGSGAALSTGLAGLVTQGFGFAAGFLTLAAIGALAFFCLMIWVPDSAKNSQAEPPEPFMTATADAIQA